MKGLFIKQDENGVETERKEDIEDPMGYECTSEGVFIRKEKDTRIVSDKNPPTQYSHHYGGYQGGYYSGSRLYEEDEDYCSWADRRVEHHNVQKKIETRVINNEPAKRKHRNIIAAKVYRISSPSLNMNNLKDIKSGSISEYFNHDKITFEHVMFSRCPFPNYSRLIETGKMYREIVFDKKKNMISIWEVKSSFDQNADSVVYMHAVDGD